MSFRKINSSDAESDIEIDDVDIDQIVDSDDPISDIDESSLIKLEADLNNELTNSGKNKKTKKGSDKTVKTKTKSTSPKTREMFSKKKNLESNLEIVFKKFGVKFNDETKKHEFLEINKVEQKIKRLSIPFVASKVSRLTDAKNLKLIITDDDDNLFEIEKYLVSNILTVKEDIILVKVPPYTIFQQGFIDLTSNVIAFSLFAELISFAFVSEQIILCNKHPITNYMFYKLLSLLNIYNKVEYYNPDILTLDFDKVYSDKIRNEYNNLEINKDVFIDFFKNDKQPSSYKEETILEAYKLINFNAQIYKESFDGLTKIIFTEIKNKNLSEFSFNTLFELLVKEYPLISEKDLFNHFMYIVKNFNRTSQIPLFDFNGRLSKIKTIKVNQKLFNKLLEFSIIIEKKSTTFWFCLIPVQLFYGKDFYSLNLKKIFNTLLDTYEKNGSYVLMTDNQNSLYSNVNKEGIVENRGAHKLELDGIDSNILKSFDPVKTKEEFLLYLLNSGVKISTNNNNLIIDNKDTAEKYLKLKTDKSNLIFDFESVRYIGKSQSKAESKYQCLLKYYNAFLKFNAKLFKLCLLNIIYQKTKDAEIKKKVLKIIWKTTENDMFGFVCFNEEELEITKYKTNIFDSFDYDNIQIASLEKDVNAYIKELQKKMYMDDTLI